MSETPILDLELDPPKMRRSWALFLFSAVLVVLILQWVPVYIEWWFPVLYASIAFHEVGHLTAGKLAAMKTGGIAVGGVMIFRSGDRWRCRFEYRRILSGGLAKPLPEKGDFDPVRYAWMVAGGPLATIILAAGAGIVLWKSGSSASSLSSLFWINLILLAGTLLPAGGINKSDGPRLWMLLRNRDESRSWIALLQVMAEETKGVLPRDWDPELVALMLQNSPKAGDNAFRQLMAFYRRNDEGDQNAALVHLENALAASGNCGRALRNACFAEAAGSCAMLRGRPAAARTWVSRAAKLRKPISPHSIDAFLAHSDGRYADALKSWDAALAFLAKRKLGSGLARYAKGRMEEYREQCREALDRPAAAAAGSS
jgi:hypothetical protein